MHENAPVDVGLYTMSLHCEHRLVILVQLEVSSDELAPAVPIGRQSEANTVQHRGCGTGLGPDVHRQDLTAMAPTEDHASSEH